jgi:hypothetical protein
MLCFAGSVGSLSYYLFWCVALSLLIMFLKLIRMAGHVACSQFPSLSLPSPNHPHLLLWPQEYGLPAEDASLLADTVELMIAEYRPLFTQPYGLNRYEQDAARAQVAAAAKAAAAAVQQQLPGASCSLLASVPLGLAPVATAPCRGAATAEEYAEGEGGQGTHWTPVSCFADTPLGFSSEEEGSPRHEVEAAMEGMLSSLLESTVSGLFEDPTAAANGEGGMHQVVLAPCLAQPARVASPAKPVPVPGNKHRLAQEGSGVAADNELRVDSYTSEDWGSFSPTAVILGDPAAYGCAASAAAGQAAAAAAEAHGVWGCKPSTGGLARLGSVSQHVMA